MSIVASIISIAEIVSEMNYFAVFDPGIGIEGRGKHLGGVASASVARAVDRNRCWTATDARGVA